VKQTVKYKYLLMFLLTFSINLFAATHNTPYNIILIINDQETFRLLPAQQYHLPARDELHHRGVTFTNHYTAAAMCSPSRATFLTGVPPQVNGVFDQEEYSYVPVLDANRPNMGSVLKKLGYRTIYFGKFEMNKKLLAVSDTTNYSTLAQPYGFDVFNDINDIGGSPLQGYTHDPYTVGEAIHWLRKNSTEKNDKPFFLVISLLNPHDIMYGDANLPNLPIAQKAAVPVIFPPPANSIYQTSWQFDLPVTLQESLQAKGMPNALWEYQTGWSKTLGYIPVERKDMWRFYYNYYLNALRDNDRNLQMIIDTLNESDQWKNTIVILTADHGEMGGAHGGLRGKGPMAYEENVHIPLIIDHPQGKHAVNCAALTSHIDLLPTLVGLTGLSTATIKATNQSFPGHDFSRLLREDCNKKDAIRQGVLFNYVGISTIDHEYLYKTLTHSFTHQALPALSEVNQDKRGFLSFVYDGRYKFARYYSPSHFNTPVTLDEILKNNDVQLFDLANDADEKNNLALDAEKNKIIILRMNKLLNDLMMKEVGVNNNRFLPAELHMQKGNKS